MRVSLWIARRHGKFIRCEFEPADDSTGILTLYGDALPLLRVPCDGIDDATRRSRAWRVALDTDLPEAVRRALP